MAVSETITFSPNNKFSCHITGNISIKNGLCSYHQLYTLVVIVMIQTEVASRLMNFYREKWHRCPMYCSLMVTEVGNMMEVPILVYS